MNKDDAFDAVIVGAGIAGLMSAVRLAELGLRVGVLEKGEHEKYPCNSRMTGGVFHVAFRDVNDDEKVLLEAMNQRSALLPEVPTIAEGGVPGYEVLGWYGIVGPAGMPKDLVSRLSTEIARILKTPEVREKILREGAEPIGNSPEEFATFLAEDQRKWARVIKAANIRPAQI